VISSCLTTGGTTHAVSTVTNKQSYRSVAATAVPAFIRVLRRRFPLTTEGVQLSLPSASACIFRRLPPPPPASVSFTFAADLPPPPGHQPSSRIFQCGRPPALVSPASVCIFRRTVHRATSVPESIRISRRSRSIGTSVLTLAHASRVYGSATSTVLIFRRSRSRPAARCTRPHTCSGHALRRYRTHSLRAFIFSVLSSRKFGSSVSVRTILLELPSLPTRASFYGIASVFA